MTFAALLSDHYDRLRYPASPAAAIVTRAKRFVNEAHREILALPGMSRLREDLLSIAYTADVPRSALPQAIGRIRGVTDRTNGRSVDEVSLSDIRASNPMRTNTGAPVRYAVVGSVPVNLQPSDASELFVKSTAAGDTNTAYLEGIRSTGSPVTLSKAMTGVTAVTMSATEVGIVEVTKFYLSVAAVGVVTLNEDSGAGTELAKIGIGRTFSKYLSLEWDPIPSASGVFYADVTRNIYDLVNDTDEPLMPEDFHYIIGLRARMKAYEGTDDTRFNALKPEWETGKIALKSWVLNDGAAVASLRPIGTGFSQLGAQFPAGS